jgi:transposase
LETSAVVMLVLVGAPGGEHAAGELEAVFAEGLLLCEPFGVAAKVALQVRAADLSAIGVERDLKGARFALWKNPEHLTARQQHKLADVQRINRRLYRAYLLKEQLRQIYRLPADEAIALLEAWLKWARRCRLAPFVKLARTITDQRAGILNAIQHGLSNARVEAINTQIRLITRRAFGFHSPDALIALAMLTLADLCPPLPR